MHFFEVEGRRYAQFERLRAAGGLVHAFSTRPMDVSVGNGPNAAIRARRRETMALDLGLESARIRGCMQVHQTRLAVIDSPAARGPLAGCDGATTALPDVPLMTFSADCPLVLVFDPVRRVLGMAHCSWRCTVTHLPRLLIELMEGRFGCRAADLQAGIGPGAGPERYEVGEDVWAAAAGLPERERLFRRRGRRLYFDLWEASRVQLVRAGVPAGSIELAGICTLTSDDIFYSFRREGAGCGHFGLMAGIR